MSSDYEEAKKKKSGSLSDWDSTKPTTRDMTIVEKGMKNVGTETKELPQKKEKKD